MNQKIEMSWRGALTLCLMCAVAVGCVAADKKLTPAKEVESNLALKITNGIASTSDTESAMWFGSGVSNTVFIGKKPYNHIVWPENMVHVSRPEWLLATNWLTTAYLLPAVREVAKPEGNIVTVIQRSQVTSNFVMVVSWQVATNQVTNTFVMQSVPVPEWSGVERWGQELVQVGR